VIRQKRLVKLIYQGKPRIIKPDDYGVNTGTVKLLSYFVRVLDDVESVEQDLRMGGVFPNQVGIWRPHVHAHHAQRVATPSCPFLCFSNACLSATPSIHMASTAITLFA